MADPPCKRPNPPELANRISPAARGNLAQIADETGISWGQVAFLILCKLDIPKSHAYRMVKPEVKGTSARTGASRWVRILAPIAARVTVNDALDAIPQLVAAGIALSGAPDNVRLVANKQLAELRGLTQPDGAVSVTIAQQLGAMPGAPPPLDVVCETLEDDPDGVSG
jgi:hypothetical protein